MHHIHNMHQGLPVGATMMNKGGGGGGKGGVGMVLSAVAMVIAPVAAPALGAAMGTSSALAAGAAYGALSGAAVAGVTGGNPIKGAVMGGVMGGIGGGLADWAATPSTPGFSGGDLGGGLSTSGGISYGGLEGVSAPFGTDSLAFGAGGELGTSTLGSGLTANAGSNSLQLGVGSSGGPLLSSMESTGAFADSLGNSVGVGEGAASITAPQYAGASSPFGGTDYARVDASTAGGTGRTSSGLDLKGMVSKAASSDNLTNAGLKLGAQALGSLASAPGSDKMESYLNDVKAMEQRSQQFNMDMANKKAGVGDSLVQSANNIDPGYYGNQAMTKSKNQTSSQWADQEAAYRAQGYDQNYINSMKNKFDVGASQNAGTAYDSGYQSGQSAKTQTYGAAGSMYGGVSQPTAGLATAYQGMNDANSKAQQGWGNAIEQAFGVVNDTTKKPAQANT